MKINDLALNQNIIKQTTNEQSNEGVSFESFFKQKLDALNNEQLKAETNTNAIATGQTENLQKSILQIDKAEMELKFALEVRNKLLEAYKQVIQTQI